MQVANKAWCPNWERFKVAFLKQFLFTFSHSLSESNKTKQVGAYFLFIISLILFCIAQNCLQFKLLMKIRVVWKGKFRSSLLWKTQVKISYIQKRAGFILLDKGKKKKKI